MRQWLNPEQAAEQSSFSTKTIYRALWAGELPASKRRNRWRIRPDALAAWVDGERTTPGESTTIPHERRAVPRGTLGKALAAQDGDAA